MSQRSQDKMRPSLPRSKDLRLVETVPNPSEGRGPDGRFAPRNRLAVRAGEKHSVKKLLGRGAADGDAALVARDGVRLLFAAMREMPSDGAVVRTMAALYARHAAVSAYFTAKADEVGLHTPAGLAFAEQATRHGQRAERLAVSMLDIATRLAPAKKNRAAFDPLAAHMAQVTAELAAEAIDEQAAADADGASAGPEPASDGESGQ